jgi:hypothetical protein
MTGDRTEEIRQQIAQQQEKDAALVKQTMAREKEALPLFRDAITQLIEDERGLRGILKDTDDNQLIKHIEYLGPRLDLLIGYEQRLLSQEQRAGMDKAAMEGLRVLSRISRIKRTIQPLVLKLRDPHVHNEDAMREHSHLVKECVEALTEIEHQLR